MRIAKTKQTRKGSRRSTPPFSPLLGMLGGNDKLPQVMKPTPNGLKPVEAPAPAESAAPAAEPAPAESAAEPAPAESAAEVQAANAELSKLDSEYALKVSKLINDAKIPTTLKLLKSVIYGINEKPFSKDIKEYESVLNYDKIQTGTLNL